jgi:hypothetical protein
MYKLIWSAEMLTFIQDIYIEISFRFLFLFCNIYVYIFKKVNVFIVCKTVYIIFTLLTPPTPKALPTLKWCLTLMSEMGWLTLKRCLTLMSERVIRLTLKRCLTLMSKRGWLTLKRCLTLMSERGGWPKQLSNPNAREGLNDPKEVPNPNVKEGMADP